MTRDRDAKREVRSRMRDTGERYTEARTALFGPSAASTSARSGPDAVGGAMVSEQLLESLDRDGYAVVRNVLPVEVVHELREWVDRLVDDDLEWRMREVERRRAAGEPDVRAFKRGSEGVVGLEVEADNPRLGPLVSGVDEVVTAMGIPLHGRGWVISYLPGWGGHEGLHCELTGSAPRVGQWDAANLLWPLTLSGGMRLVPGSHRRDPVFREAFSGAVAPHSDEVHPDAGPGDVVVASAHIWKSATLNQSTSRRTSIAMLFRSDDAVSTRIADRWASAEILDGGAPWEPGNYVTRTRE